MILSTARLSIRELVEDDASFVVQLLNDPAFIQYVGDKGVRTLDDAREYIRSGPRAMYAEFGFGLWVAELPDGTPIGLCGLLKRPVLDDVDLGFALLPQFRREGYTLEAASAVMAHARETLRLDRLVAIVNPENEASARLLERLGFSFEELRTVFPGAPPLKLFAAPLKRGHSTLR
jgi:ribosomal-protein-alanine N-acetyltransferase